MLERDLIHDCTCNKRIGIEDCKLHCIVFNKEIQSENGKRVDRCDILLKFSFASIADGLMFLTIH